MPGNVPAPELLRRPSPPEPHRADPRSTRAKYLLQPPSNPCARTRQSVSARKLNSLSHQVSETPAAHRTFWPIAYEIALLASIVPPGVAGPLMLRDCRAVAGTARYQAPDLIHLWRAVDTPDIPQRIAYLADRRQSRKCLA